MRRDGGLATIYLILGGSWWTECKASCRLGIRLPFREGPLEPVLEPAEGALLLE